MVFPDDPSWQQDFHRFHSTDARQHVRFRTWHTEELLIECCMKYMPWLRRIHILLATETQAQPWMQRYDKLHLVYHRDFIPSGRLPCFASPCIEMFLKDIPGLAEQFIYANDDMFPLSPLAPTDFFRDGKPCVHVSNDQYPKDPNVFERKCLNQQNMIGKPFGKQYRRTLITFGHSFAPILKSACEDVWHRHSKEILDNLSPLRRTKHSYNHYIYLLYQYFARQNIDHAPRHQYAGKDKTTDQLASIIAQPDAGIVCINDNENIRDWQQRADAVRKAISKKISVAANRTNQSNQTHQEEGSTVAIVHYNTPKLTYYCIRSLLKHTKVRRIVILDNSDTLPFMSKNKEWVAATPLVKVIDNTHGQIIDFGKWIETFPDREPSPCNNYGSAKHCYSVQWLYDYINSPFLLMDSDVLIHRDITPFLRHPDCAWVGEVGENVRERFGYNIMRVLPFFCYINVPLLKQHGISYFNGEYMWNLTHKSPNHRYDTGAWLYRAVSEAGIPTYELPLSNYILHLGHASWRNRRPMDWLNNHKDCWM